MTEFKDLNTNDMTKKAPQKDRRPKEKFPDSLEYDAKEDIYSKSKRVSDLNPDDLSKKSPNEPEGTLNEKDFKDDMSGDDLDIPGAELDDRDEEIGEEDEENNYYSLGGDNHENLEES